MKINEAVQRVLTLELKNDEIVMFKYILDIASSKMAAGTQEDQLLQSIRSYLEED